MKAYRGTWISSPTTEVASKAPTMRVEILLVKYMLVVIEVR